MNLLVVIKYALIVIVSNEFMMSESYKNDHKYENYRYELIGIVIAVV